MRIEELSKRIAGAPRGVVLALIALSLLISPGYVRHAASGGAGLERARERGSLPARRVAVLALTCRDGVFTASCLRFTARVSDALELHAGVAGPVRSLARERAVHGEAGALRLEPLLPRPLENEPGLRALAARVRTDDARLRRFVAPGERATFVYADLDASATADDVRALVASLAARFDRAPGLAVTARGVGADAPARGGLGGAALLFALAAFALAPGSWRVAALASLAALAFTGFAHGLLGLLDERERALVGFAPELLAAGAFAASLALIARARAEHRLERAPRPAVAAALAAIGPALALVALLCACGVAASFAFTANAPDARTVGAAAGLAAGLVAYPLGVTLAGLLAWPQLLTSAPSELSAWLGKRVERGLARPRVISGVVVAALALTACALALLQVDPAAVELHSYVLDAGAADAALEPAFLERVQAVQRELERQPGVLWSSSLVDAIVAPANRALHDRDPVFATVPPTRQDVVQALQPWQRSDRAGVARQLDAERRRVAIEVLSAPAAAFAVPARPFASTGLALLGVAAIGAALLRSARGGVLAALPAAATAACVLALTRAFPSGSGAAGAVLAPLSAGLSAGLGMHLLVRTRALLAERAQLEVALSLALRESAPALASAALAASAAIALAGVAAQADRAQVALACAVPVLAAGSALAILPVLVRAARGGFLTPPDGLHETVSQARR